MILRSCRRRCTGRTIAHRSIESAGRPSGLEPGDVKTLADFERVPTITKADLRADQAENPPFGSYLCVDKREVKRIHGTSGTSGRPTAFAWTPRDMDAIARDHARIMWSFGLRPDDVVFVGSIFSLYVGSWGALIGAERLGATVFPFGAGVKGQTQQAVSWIEQMRPTAFYGTPSYALRLAEVAREQGYDPRRLGLRDHVLLRRARRGHTCDKTADRSDVRRDLHRQRQYG